MTTAQGPNYGAITVPVLIITGSDDVTGPLTRPKEILKKFGSKESEKTIKELCGVGNWICIEAPDDVRELIGRFIRTLT